MQTPLDNQCDMQADMISSAEDEIQVLMDKYDTDDPSTAIYKEYQQLDE